MEKKTIGSFIAALRKAKGLTQRQLAEMLNVSDKAISRWERDETAPDLSLIPVLADIFDVTSDELLRGQRGNYEANDSKYEAKQTEKQIHYLLNRSKNEFQMRCVITALIALCGFIAAMICNSFHRANLGFYVALIFYVTASACQAIFLIKAKSSTQSNDIGCATAISKELVVLSQTVYTVITGLAAATLPLLTYISDPYWGLSGRDWFLHGAIHAAAGILITQLVIYIINCKLGYAMIPDFKTPKNKLRIRTLLSICLILTVTFAAHVFTHEFLLVNPQYYAEGTQWDSWEELKEYLETPLSPQGDEMKLVSYENGAYQYIGADGTIHYVYEDKNSVLVYESDMQTPKYEYTRKNFFVARFSYSFTEDHFPIFTYSYKQMSAAENKLTHINLAICALYIIELLGAIMIYIKKSKKM